VALPIVLVPHPHVRVDPKVLGGSPHVVGSRVPVRRLYAFYCSGVPIERLLKRYPQLGAARVFDALAFALDNPEVIEADMLLEDDLLAKAGVKSPRSGRAENQMELPFSGDAPEPGKSGRKR
jgi:uncharacterized protein (DUF433 family)